PSTGWSCSSPRTPPARSPRRRPGRRMRRPELSEPWLGNGPPPTCRRQLFRSACLSFRCGFVDARNYGAARLEDCADAPPRLRLVQLDGEYVLRVAIERVRLLWEDPHVSVPLDLHQDEAGADLMPADVGGAEHGVTVHAGREVVDLRRLREEAGPGETVLAVGLGDVV